MRGHPADVSVILATARRPDLLDRTLTSLAGVESTGGLHEVLVVDNAGDPETEAVCERHARAVPLRFLVETGGGKNAALNHAIEHAGGKLLAFTDDDVEVSPTWLAAHRAAAERWPDHAVFGGKVLPLWPAPCPETISHSKYFNMIFSVVDRPASEGPDPDFNPFGPNLMIRRTIFDSGVRYDASVGPGTAASYAMGSETDLIRRLRAGGHEAVYVPASVVHHRIRPEQFSFRWLLGRAMRYGRMIQVRNENSAGSRRAGIPRWMIRSLVQSGISSVYGAVTGDRTRALDRAMDAAVTWGRLAQSRWQNRTSRSGESQERE